MYQQLPCLLREHKIYEWMSHIGADGDIKNNT